MLYSVLVAFYGLTFLVTAVTGFMWVTHILPLYRDPSPATHQRDHLLLVRFLVAVGVTFVLAGLL